MKKIFLIALSFSTLCVTAQKKTVTKKTTTKTASTVQSATALRTLNDSASYAIGLSVAQFYSQQGVKNLNASAVAKAISDVFKKNNQQIADHQINDIIMKFMDLAQAEKAKPVLAANQQFLTENKKKPGIKTTSTGLQYEVLVEGKGPKPVATDTVVVNYAGTLIDGTEFDNSYKRGQPIEFPLNRVIKGWTEALQLMPVGSKYKLYIPQDLGYGLNGNGGIPGGATLVFEVELLAIKGK